MSDEEHACPKCQGVNIMRGLKRTLNEVTGDLAELAICLECNKHFKIETPNQFAWWSGLGEQT